MATSVDMTQRAFAVAFDNLAILRALLQKAEWRMQLATGDNREVFFESCYNAGEGGCRSYGDRSTN